MMVSWMGNPAPLLSCSSVEPLMRVTSTLNEEIEELAESLVEKP
jgi:hypothetical protein